MVLSPNSGEVISKKIFFRPWRVWKWGILFFGIILFLFVLNIQTTTRQGINHEVKEIKIPLYLKLSNFLDRHWNYQWLVNQIVIHQTGDWQKVESIFRWTGEHIADQPPQLYVIDDHVWHIIVRGYGTEEQKNDVFATLCNYAGMKAVLVICHPSEKKVPSRLSLSAVFIEGAWRLCDPSMKVIFKNKENKWATVSDVFSGDGKPEFEGGPPKGKGLPDYSPYIPSLRGVDFDKLYRINRSSIQNPLARFFYFLHDRKI